MASGKRVSKTLIVLLGVLGVVAAAGAVHRGQIVYYERQLRSIAHALVEEANENDPRPVPELGPEADVEIDVTCSFEHLFYGEKTGKIILYIKPRAHAPETTIGSIEYVYVHRDGEWQLVESYHGDVPPAGT